MPSTITHAYFSMDLYDRFNDSKQKILEPYKQHLKTFAQGPDVFFFYNLWSSKSGKRIRKLGSYMQQNKTQDFFVNLITTIKDRKLEYNPEVRSFLYGFISHYVLDMTVHPYIVFKTGIYDKKIKSSKKYFGKHDELEAYIDAYFVYVRNKVRPHNFKSHNFCFPKTHISLTLERLIDDVFKQTFKEKYMGRKYISSVIQMKYVYKYFRNDRSGVKKKIYKLLQVLPFNVKLEAISYNITLDKNEYYLNTDKQPWSHPLDRKEVYEYSFIELYSIALNRALNLIEDTDKALIGKKNIPRLNELYPNLSYLTGKDCKLGKGNYFSF